MMRRPLPPGLKIFCCSASAKRAYKGKLLYDVDHIFAMFLVILEFLALYWQKLEYQHVQDDLLLQHQQNTLQQLVQRH
jgi:hypothetical protein